jgi:hypothetical protein
MKTIVMVIIPVAIMVVIVAFLVQGRTAENPHGPLEWDCTACHTTESWHTLRKDMEFDHNKTGFRLDGSHRKVNCASCHQELVFSHVGTACADCHADHHLGQLGTDCAGCHTPQDWQPRQDILQQHAERGFPLTGVHAVADCEACHRDSERGEFIGTPSDCFSCHSDLLTSVKDPDHSQADFQDDCERCHHAAFGSWNQTTYDHTGIFPLTGAHSTVPCSACHQGTFAGTPNTCFDCHEADYSGTTDPDHTLSGFATTCQDCHSTAGWSPATFDHAETGFPLTGQHVGLQCIACHESGYMGTQTACIACHQSDYDGTTDPNHVQNGFALTCQDCHSAAGWSPATFDHAETDFPLTGQHVGLQCIACHESTYTGTQSACIACHQSDYDGTTDPNHAAALFPTDCESCHTTNGWTPSTWDHDALYFPIYSGAHRGRWDNCSDCHTVPTDFGVFECINCHEHNQTDTDNDHNDVRDYQYVSSACYTCHPQGRH